MAQVYRQTAGADARDAKGRRIIDWVSWKIFLPLVLIVGFWPLYYSLGLEHPFQKACAPGELLIFSALILIEVAVEGQSLRGASLWLHSTRTLAIILGILLVVPLAVFKLQAAQLEGSGAHDAHEKLLIYSTFGCAVAVAAVLLGFITFCITVSKEYDISSFAVEERRGQSPRG